MKICLDAGHYGKYNQSPVVKNYYESEVVWKITNYQKQFLEEYSNVTVILTRTDINKDMAVYNRGYAAKGCDLFISNHSNATSTESTDYPVVIRSYDNKNNSDELGLQLANKIADLMNTKQSGRTWTRKTDSGTEYYGVLRGARAAGLSHYYIIEHSFHTNKNAATWLLNEANIKALAKAEVEVIAAYYGLKKKTTSTSTPTTSTGSYLVKVTADVLNVRAGAGTNYKINTQVKKGEVYTIVDESNGFLKLKSGAGWICLDYTEKTVLDNTPPSYLVEITTDVLNIRKDAGTSYDIVGSVTRGQVFTIVETKNNWGKLKSGAGWICLDYTVKC